MEVILDTSFILTCLKEKIDFLEAGKFGELVLPRQVLEEITQLSKTKGRQKELSLLALDIIRMNKKNFRVINLKKRYVDAGIRKYVENKREAIVATLDAELKRDLKGKVKLLVIRARKKLELV